MSVGVGVGVRPLRGRTMGVRDIFIEPVGLVKFIKGAVPYELTLAGEQEVSTFGYLFVGAEGRVIDDTRLPANIGRGRFSLKRFELFQAQGLPGVESPPEVFEVERSSSIIELLVLVEAFPARFKSTTQTGLNEAVLIDLRSQKSFSIHVPRFRKIHLLVLLVLLQEKKGQDCAHSVPQFLAVIVIVGVESHPQAIGWEVFKQEAEVQNGVSYPAIDSIPFLTDTGILVFASIARQELPVSGGEKASASVRVGIGGHIYRVCIITPSITRRFVSLPQPYSKIETEFVDTNIISAVLSTENVMTFAALVGGRMSSQFGENGTVDGSEYPEDPRPKRRTPYTSIGVHPEIRDALADIRDTDHRFDTYGDVLCELIENAQEDLSTE